MSKVKFTNGMASIYVSEIEKAYNFQTLFNNGGLTDAEYVRAITGTMKSLVSIIAGSDNKISTRTLRDFLENYTILGESSTEGGFIIGFARGAFLELLDKDGDLSLILNGLYDMSIEGIIGNSDYERVKNGLLGT